MTMSFKEAAESTVQTLSEFVDEATSRLEDLPVPFQRHHRSSRRRPAFIVVAVVAGLAVVVFAVSRRRSTRATSRTTSGAGPSTREHAQPNGYVEPLSA